MHVDGFVPDHNVEDVPSFDRFKPKFEVRAASSLAYNEWIIPEYTPISNQGDWPSCTANAVLDTAEALIGLQDPTKVVQLSRMAGWYCTRLKEGTEHSIIGCRLSSVFRVLEEFGACPESMWPYDPPPEMNLTPEQWVMKKPKLAALESMSDNKILGWAQIFEIDDSLLDAIDYALLSNHPVDYGTAIDASFRDYEGEDVVLSPPGDTDLIIGRHAIAVFGVRKRLGRREYWIRNSWSRNWGMAGHVWVDQSYLTWSEAMNHTVGTLATEIIL